MIRTSGNWKTITVFHPHHSYFFKSSKSLSLSLSGWGLTQNQDLVSTRLRALHDTKGGTSLQPRPFLPSHFCGCCSCPLWSSALLFLHSLCLHPLPWALGKGDGQPMYPQPWPGREKPQHQKHRAQFSRKSVLRLITLIFQTCQVAILKFLYKYQRAALSVFTWVPLASR